MKVGVKLSSRTQGTKQKGRGARRRSMGGMGEDADNPSLVQELKLLKIKIHFYILTGSFPSGSGGEWK